MNSGNVLRFRKDENAIRESVRAIVDGDDFEVGEGIIGLEGLGTVGTMARSHERRSTTKTLFEMYI
jgi:hypothetical protein